MPPDPGLLRMVAALRATSAGLLTFLLVAALGLVLPLTVFDRILGFAVALFASATLRDPKRPQQAVTILLAGVSASLTVTAAALLSSHRIVTELLVPVIMFAATYGSTRAPRWSAVGTVSLIAYIVALVTHQSPGSLAGGLLTVWLGVAGAAVIRFVLIPDRPAADLRRLRRSIRRRLAAVLAMIAEVVQAGRWSAIRRAAFRHELDRLDEAILMTETRLTATGADAAGLTLYLLELQLTTQHVARAARQDIGNEARRPRLSDTLTMLARGLLADDPIPVPVLSQRPAGELESALALLATVLHEAPKPMLEPVSFPPPIPPPAGIWPGLHPALQAAVAAALAISFGELVSHGRWYWAAFAAFAMFQGTRSRGESIAKVAQFMVGTLAGVIAGVLLATALAGHTLLSLAMIVAAVFLAFQAYMAAYGVMVFWITIILALMFGMMGYFAPELLLVRLEETSIGAASGVLVACLVLPRSGRAVIETAFASLLRALGYGVAAAVTRLTGGEDLPDLPGALLMSAQRLHDLHVAVTPVLSGPGTLRNPLLRERVLLLQACDEWAQELGRFALQGVRLCDPDLLALARTTAATISANIAALLEPVPPGDRTEPPRLSLPAVPLNDAQHYAVRLLLRIDAAILRLMTRDPRPLDRRPGTQLCRGDQHTAKST
ncbi:MAG TPA: FUSC family protein [Acetobacteraceae bacterium]